MFNVTWSVTGDTGPGSMSFGATLQVEAVERISASIEPGAEESFEILADQMARLRLLVVSASRYTDVTVGPSDSELAPMTAPMVATGSMLRFMGAAGTARVVVNNAGPDVLAVDIVVCRDPNA